MKKLSVFSMIGVILLNIGGIAYSQEYKDIVKDTSDCMPKSTNILAAKTKILEGQTFRFIKFMDSDGNISSVILDPAGKAVAESDLPTVEHSVIENDLSIYCVKSLPTQII